MFIIVGLHEHASGCDQSIKFWQLQLLCTQAAEADTAAVACHILSMQETTRSVVRVHVEGAAHVSSAIDS